MGDDAMVVAWKQDGVDVFLGMGKSRLRPSTIRATGSFGMEVSFEC